jgi:dTDP-4-dehydrorhamnose reductase
MRVAVIGASGRLGAVLTAELASREHTVAALGSADLDLTRRDSVDETLGDFRPDAIVNCSAYNAVDAAQTDMASAFALNAAGPAFLADFARRSDAILVHYSTDFVFDGTASEPYTEESATNPLSVYGASKLAGENEARNAPRHYVLRIESLFGGVGLKGHRSTVDHIADRIASGDLVRAAVDRTVSPTYVPDAARATADLLEGGIQYGLYHCVNGGYTTWYELAHEIARQLGAISANIVPMRADDLTVVAPRPRFCALANGKLAARGVTMPTWRSALARHLTASLPARLPQHAAVAALRLP